VALALFAGCCVLQAAALLASPAPPATIHPESTPETNDVRFRLGTAGQPFNWATVVADFNGDGTPDVAVADRLPQRTGDYVYRIEFDVSGSQPVRIVFASNQPALTLSLADVDHDNDLDVVVRSALSGVTVGVWLNDGRGGFAPGDLELVPHVVRAECGLGAACPGVDVTAIGSSGRVGAALLSLGYGALPPPASSIAPTQSRSRRRGFVSSSSRPRSPPQSFLSAL
jgi:hypothetical protein